MNLKFGLPVILLGMIISQGIFASILLLVSRKNEKANIFLGLMVLAFSLWLCDAFFSVSGIYSQNPNYYFLPIYFSFAFGPLLFFYTKSLVSKDFKFRTVDLIHFAPPLGQFLLYIFLQSKDYAFRRWFWMEIHEPFTYNLEFNLSLLSLLIYIYLSFKLLKEYKKFIINEYSEISKIDLRWLHQLFIAISIMAFAWMIEAFMRMFYGFFPNQILVALPMGFLVLFLAVGGLFQQKLKLGISTTTEASSSLEIKKVDEELLKMIQDKMMSEQFFLDPELSLETFSNHLNLNKRTVSESINNGLGIPFIDFVNAYRIDYFVDLTRNSESKNLTLLGLAFDSGFNSKSTFNRVFRKLKNESPSSFLKSQDLGS